MAAAKSFAAPTVSDRYILAVYFICVHIILMLLVVSWLLSTIAVLTINTAWEGSLRGLLKGEFH